MPLSKVMPGAASSSDRVCLCVCVCVWWDQAGETVGIRDPHTHTHIHVRTHTVLSNPRGTIKSNSGSLYHWFLSTAEQYSADVPWSWQRLKGLFLLWVNTQTVVTSSFLFKGLHFSFVSSFCDTKTAVLLLSNLTGTIQSFVPIVSPRYKNIRYDIQSRNVTMCNHLMNRKWEKRKGFPSFSLVTVTAYFDLIVSIRFLFMEATCKSIYFVITDL